MTCPISRLYQVKAVLIRMKNWMRAIPIATIGTVIGDRRSAVIAGRPGSAERTSAMLAPSAISVAQAAAPRAISALMTVASKIRWIFAMFAYQLIDSAFGGNSMKNEALNDTIAVTITGKIRNASAAQASAEVARLKERDAC